MKAALDYLTAHPELWPLIILPTLGAILNPIGRAIASRWPALSPIVRAGLDALPNLPGAIMTLAAKRPLDPPPPPPAPLPKDPEVKP